MLDRGTLLSGFERGLPDGSCLDDEGYIWNCRVGGGNCLVRIHPEGILDCVIELPCSSPTSCTFGGKHLDTLYVTSARFGMTSDDVRSNPQKGALFAVNTGHRGMPANRFGRQGLRSC
ncbi:hypothetical protein GH983_22085 (plasmid) [Agrobacterium sp. MA01]|nr:hypothetical protein GH983_22085 [Agrobacterium sp. MA01]